MRYIVYLDFFLRFFTVYDDGQMVCLYITRLPLSCYIWYGGCQFADELVQYVIAWPQQERALVKWGPVGGDSRWSRSVNQDLAHLCSYYYYYNRTDNTIVYPSQTLYVEYIPYIEYRKRFVSLCSLRILLSFWFTI